MTDHQSVVREATQSLKWSAFAEILTRTTSPIVLVVLARLLTPHDFGIVSTAAIAISFCQVLWEAGLGRALIQTQAPPKKAANVVFWANLTLSIVVYAALFAMAPLIGTFFRAPDTLWVLRILGLQIPIGALTTVQQALLTRKMDFRGLFWIKLCTVFLPGLCSIPLACMGLGPWALVAGTLTGATINLCLLWRLSRWRPAWNCDWALVRQLCGFGAWVVAEAVGVWILLWGDNLVVARFLGTQELGIYRTGWNVCAVVFGSLLNPFLPVLYPAFSRLQNDREALRLAFLNSNKVILAVSIPLGVLCFALGQEAAMFVFGPKWQGLGFVIQTIGLLSALTWSVGSNLEVYRAMGRPDIGAKVILIACAYYLPTYVMAGPHGMRVFILARIAVGMLSIALHVFFAVRLLRVHPLYLWHGGKAIFSAATVMLLVMLGTKWVMPRVFLGLGAFPQLAVAGVMAMASYILALRLFDAPFVAQLHRLALRALRR